jgi:hypothetical protein
MLFAGGAQIAETRHDTRFALIIDRRLHSYLKPGGGGLGQLDSSAGVRLSVSRH